MIRWYRRNRESLLACGLLWAFAGCLLWAILAIWFPQRGERPEYRERIERESKTVKEVFR